MPDTDDLLPCPLCAKAFANLQRLDAHCSRRHAGLAITWTCSVCAKQYDDCEQWKRHVRRRHDRVAKEEEAPEQIADTPESAFQCADCINSYRSAERLTRHRERRHALCSSDPVLEAACNEEESIGGKCDDCDKCYSDDSRLKRHRERRHDVESAVVAEESAVVEQTDWQQCDSCEKRCATVERLERHRARRHNHDEMPASELDATMPDPESPYYAASEITSPCEPNLGNGAQPERRQKQKIAASGVQDSPTVGGSKFDLPSTNVDKNSAQSFMNSTSPPATFECNTCLRCFSDGGRLHRHRARKHDKDFQGEEEEILSGAMPNPEIPVDSATDRSTSVAPAIFHLPDGVTQLQCDQCEKSFTETERLERHRNRKHANQTIAEQSSLAIPPTEQSDLSPSVDVRHVKESKTRLNKANSSAKGEFQQIICGTSVGGQNSNIDFLRKRNYVFPRPKIHACRQCGKLYKTANEREVHHRRRHSGLSVYKCAICNWRCFKKGTMAEHETAHRGERPFACTLCSVAFVKKSARTVHMRYHNDERPFKCDVCDKAFHINSNLTTHRVIHTGERPYECSHCGSRFKLAGHLSRHKNAKTICLHADALPKRNLEVMIASV